MPGSGGGTKLDETLIVVKGEFGRTVGNITDRQGRDHYFVHSTLIAGGGVRGGHVLGKTTPDGAYVDDPGWSEQRPVYAEDIAATIYSALGINYTTVRHDDPLGRGFPLEWPYVMMVAAGRVRLEETSQSRPHATVTRHDLFGTAQPQLLTDLGREGEGNHHLVLDIILTRAVLGYSTTADKFNFQYLGERKAAAESANFALLVRDLATFAPHAILNRGAQSLIQDAKEVFDYPSRNAFHEETIWLLWRLAQSGAA